MRKLHGVVLLWLLWLPVPGGAFAPTALRSTESQVDFQIRLWLGQVRGSFHHVSGALRHEKGQVRICAQLPVAGVRLASDAQRRDLLGPDFFDAATHPQIRFVSSAVPESLLRSGGVLAGRLSMRGQTRDAQFQLAPMSCAPDRPAECGVALSGEVQRSDFGMRAKPGVLGNTVRLQLHLRTCAVDTPSCPVAPGCFRD